MITLSEIRQTFNAGYSGILSVDQIDDAVNWFGQLHNDGVEDSTAALGAIALVKKTAQIKLSRPEAKALRNPLVKRYA